MQDVLHNHFSIVAVMWACCAGVIALLMSDMPFYTDPVKYPNNYMSSPLLPVILSLLIGYIVASVFFNVR